MAEFEVGPKWVPQSPEDWKDLAANARHIFKPRAPIDDNALFAGRLKQVDALLGVIYETGAHAVMYGERGVGKTSLANIIKDHILGDLKFTTVIKVSCAPGDTFANIWSNVFFDYQWDGKPVGDAIKQNPQPFTVHKVAASLGKGRFFLVVLDEFDRIRDEETKTLMADTIKYLSDSPVNFTVVVVGVGASIGELFGRHPSIQRCCVQILMPRMSATELSQIVNSRIPRLGMTVDPQVVLRMVQFSQGLPGYMHLLGQLSALAAIERDSMNVSASDLDRAVGKVLDVADETTRRDYYRAIRSTKPDNRYREVLLACAKAKKNELGEFSASDVAVPYSRIMARKMGIEHFARHLNAFCEADRGPALIKSGKRKGFLYRFANPLLEPLVIMIGAASASIPPIK